MRTRGLPWAALAAAVVLGGCGAELEGAPGPERAAGTQTAPPTTATTPAPTPGPEAPPRPATPLARGSAGLARQLAAANAAVDREAGAYLRDANPRRDPIPEALSLHALLQQRIFRRLGRSPALARRVIARLPAKQRRGARETAGALHSLFRLSAQTRITRRSTLRVGRPLPMGQLEAHYRAAQRRFATGWHVLAAVNFVETAFNKLRNNSVAGAQGPMQFIPSTWRAYGMGGNIRDPRDAIMGAANYLKANGAPRDYRRALFRYNPSSLYVDAVRRYARRIAASRRALVAYYAWQVFVRDPGGERRLTGPGL